jgi:hypothetical protein
MPSVLSGLQRGVASALPGCDYHDPANFELERRRIFHRNWFCVGRASLAAGGPASPRLDPASRPAANQEGQHGRGPDPSPAAIARLSGDTCQPWALAGRRGHS